MIGKIPKAGRGFKGIVRYLLQGPKHPAPPNGRTPERHNGPSDERPNATQPERQHAKHNRVLWAETRNLLTQNPEQALRIMRATANRSARCKAPVYHFVVSWTPEENPSTDVMKSVVEATCRDMELTDHQAIIVAHDDTRHRHVHVVVNRIHPETGLAWNRRQDWVRLEQSLARQAKTLGLRHVPGRHNAPELYGDGLRMGRDTEYQMARRRGEHKPAMAWSKNRIAQERTELARIFNEAQNWQDLAASLAKRGLRLKGKGHGHVLTDGTSEVKLSQVSKAARINLLEQRFKEAWTPSIPLEPEVPPYKPQRKLQTNSQPSPYVSQQHSPQTANPQLSRPKDIQPSPLRVDPSADTRKLVDEITPNTHEEPPITLQKGNRRLRKRPRM